MPRSSESASKKKSGTQRRRQRRFGGWRRKAKIQEDHGGSGFDYLTNGISASKEAVYWVWHTTISTLGWSSYGVREKGGREGARRRQYDEVQSSSSREETAKFGLVLGIVALAGVFMFRYSYISLDRVRRRKGGSDQAQRRQRLQGVAEGQRSIGKARTFEGDETRENTTTDSKDEQTIDQARSSEYRRITTAEARASGERRLSLYDVLTAETPLPTPREEEKTESTTAVARTAASDDANSMGEGLVRGIFDGSGRGDAVGILGRSARRPSIFDRIADVVFNEEQKKEDPVDAIAVRGKLDQEFRVSFREGAMGMTLSMDPDSRDAFVGIIVEQGQAFRAGVQTGDLVIGVGEQAVTSYGTVLAFMNIMGRPIELHFRKADLPSRTDDGGPGGGPVSSSNEGAAGGNGGGHASTAEGDYDRSSKSGPAPARRSTDRARGDSLSRKFKGFGNTKSARGNNAPASPISPRSSSKVSKLGRLDCEVASSDSDFSRKMEHGVVVTKYDKKGAAAQRVLYLDVATMSVAWRELDARSSPGRSSPGHRRTLSLTSMLKGKHDAFELANLVDVIGGDDPDPTRPTERGSAMLREHCDEALLPRSFSLQFTKQSLEITCDSQVEMHQLVTGFRDLRKKFGKPS